MFDFISLSPGRLSRLPHSHSYNAPLSTGHQAGLLIDAALPAEPFNLFRSVPLTIFVAAAPLRVRLGPL